MNEKINNKKSWIVNPQILNISDNDVHIWCVNVDQSEKSVEILNEYLSEDENNRKNNFYFEEDERRYAVTRGFLRSILGKYLKKDPGELQFTYSKRGKPELKKNSNKELCFNLSHSNNLALYAISFKQSIGVDIEYIQYQRDEDDVAKNFFSSREYNFISKLPEAQKVEAFYHIWTCKEAYLKATGVGLAGLKDVEVPEMIMTSVSKVKTDNVILDGWTMYRVPLPQHDYVASLVVEGERRNCKFSLFSLI